MASVARLLDAPFDAGEELRRFAAGHADAGGVVSFLGQVRAADGTEPVLALELSDFAPLTLPGIRALLDQAHQRWSLTGLLALHRVGVLEPGDPIVFVAAAARHRRDAFAAADFVMDHLKSDAWLWKRERTASGWRWVEPRPQDHADRARW
jgi:molybdopterin synthase catalytic subunit